MVEEKGNQEENKEDLEVKEEEVEEEVLPHPHAELLANFQPPALQLETRDPIIAPSLEATPFALVTTKEQLSATLVKLKETTEMAVALGYIVQDSFRGIISLIQISTR